MAGFLDFEGDYTGLEAELAEKRLGIYGLNSNGEFDDSHYRVSSAFLNPVFIIQTAAAAFSMIGGDFFAGGILLALNAIFAINSITNGKRADSQLHELKRSAALKIRVIRDGKLDMIRKEYLVPDDIVILEAGENVPADLVLLEADRVTVDESVFAQADFEQAKRHKKSNFVPDEHDEPEEHSCVSKKAGENKNERDNCVYKGCRVLTGKLVGKVFATGVDTRIYKLAGRYADVNLSHRYGETEIESAVNKNINMCYIISIVAFIAAIVFSLINAEVTTDIKAFIYSLTAPALAFALCFMPSQTASLVRSYYISAAVKLGEQEQHAILKDLSVVEKINAMTCLCIDKAGAVTKDSIEVTLEYSPSPQMLHNIAVLACSPKPQDAIDKAIVLHATFNGLDVRSLYENKLLKEYPFDKEKKAAGNLWEVNGARLLCIKGLPENIFSVCKIKEEAYFKASAKLSSFTKQGCQVIAVAFTEIAKDEPIPRRIFDIRYSFMGLIAFTNQPRDTVPYAVKSCYKAGVEVIMTTGDSAETALTVGEKIGLKKGKVITGNELKDAARHANELKTDASDAEENEQEFDIDISGVNIFAKITPEQKLGILKLLQKNGEIVGISGDNVTDAAILQQADVGIARAGSSTGAAYEAADMIMSDNNFNNVVETIKFSRQAHRNIKRCISTVLSAHIALILAAAIMLFCGMSPITPVIAALAVSLIIPSAGLIYSEDSSDMKTDLVSSRFIGRGAINKKFFIFSAVQGAALAVGIIVFRLFCGETDSNVTNALTFMQFISGLLTMCAVNYSERPFTAFFKNKKNHGIFIAGIILAVTIIIICIPYVNTVFGMKLPDPFLLLIAAAAGFVSQIWFEIVKQHERRKN